jgi:ribosome maturation factor RimP
VGCAHSSICEREKTKVAKKKITDIITDELSGFLEQEGYELYHLEMVKVVKDWFLRVYIDKKQDSEERGYISTDDCEKVSRYLSEKLDAIDPIEQNYYLEVSSPGMDRQLYTDAHYQRFIGTLVELKLYKPYQGTKMMEAVLKGVSEAQITLEDKDGNEIVLPREQVAQTRLAINF